MAISPEKFELGNGLQVSLESYNFFCDTMNALVEKGDVSAIHLLVEKCRNRSFELTSSAESDPKRVLERYKLLDANDNVHEDFRRIVLSGIEKSSESVLRVSIPIRGDSVKLKIRAL